MHRLRKKRGADMLAPRRKARANRTRKAKSILESCRIIGCGRPIRCKGLCSGHYVRQLNRPGDWSAPIMEYGGRVRAGTLSLPPEHLKFLDAEADARRTTRHALVREAVAEWIERRQKPAQATREEELGPEPPTLGMTPQEAIRRRETVILGALRDGVSPAMLRERFCESGVDPLDVARRHGLEVRREKHLPLGV